MTKFLEKLNIVHCGDRFFSRSIREELSELGKEVEGYGTPGASELVERAQKEKIDVVIANAAAQCFTDFHDNNPWGKFLETLKGFNSNMLVIATTFDSDYSEREKYNIEQLTESNIKHINADNPTEVIARRVVSYIIEAGLLEGQDLADAKAFVGNSRQQQSDQRVAELAR